MTRPTGSKPASRTSTNSLTERSLVNRRRWRMSARRSFAWTGRSPCWLFGSLTGGLVELERRFDRLFGGDLDVVLVVLGFDQRVVAAAERDHRQHERRQL